MNLPNKLSLSRILIMPLFVGLLLAPDSFEEQSQPLMRAWMHGVAFLIAIAVAVTDWLDGHLARRDGLITPLGKLLDPLADKVFVTGALVVLCELRLIPAWAVVLVIAREFLVTGLRSVAVEQGVVIAADRLGKHKTGWQLALILCAIFASAVRAGFVAAGSWDTVRADYWGGFIFGLFIWVPLSVSILLTVASGWNYLMANRAVLRE
ncbi:CDP-diacylglycerol--glycerol-3-phosphate 3-phosphatidyltransferase [bacterium]|nr:CDP-diacylglycerol--glycerol-3-phosphate 3-phosphatidyltransferase [bacterium]